MPKFQNNFSAGIIDKDNDERFVPPNTMTDAENALVVTSQGSEGGVLKNVLGNVKKSTYGFAGAKTIGTGKNPSKNKVYNFIKATSYDYIIEYDTVTELSVIVLQSTTGTRLNFKTGERIRNVDVIVDPEGNGDLIAFSGDTNPPRIINIDRAKTWGIDGFTQEEIMLIKAPPTYSPIVVAVNTAELIQNFLEERFISFCYRYKYKDGYYSAISSWEEYCFTPGRFNLDFTSFENLGMVNIFNAADISFNTGEREVIAVDLLFKESGAFTIYKIDQFVKEDEGWGDNSTETIQFNNAKIYEVLPLDQYFRSFDNVPMYNVGQTMIGSRAALANLHEGRDLIDINGKKCVMNYTLDLVANEYVKKNLSIIEFDSSNITGVTKVLSFNFTGANLSKGSIISLNFDITSIIIPGTHYIRNYSFILPDDYLSIEDLVNGTPTANDFKSKLEGLFGDIFQANGGLSIPAFGTVYEFFGFEVNVVNENTITIDLPSVVYQITSDPPTDPPTIVGYEFENYKDVVTTASVESVGSKKSMKSYRSYEIAMLYRDKQIRKTTALTSTENTISIPIQNSVMQNIISVHIPPTQLAPVGYETYKFAIKENIHYYEEIYASVFYKDGIFRWIKLDGGNKNKVQEGDFLIVKRDVINNINVVTKIKVLEIKEQPIDFILGNVDSAGQPVREVAGLFMKIKPSNFSIDYAEKEFINLYQKSSVFIDRPVAFLGGYNGGNGLTNPDNPASLGVFGEFPGPFTDVSIQQGSTVYMKFNAYYNGDQDRNIYENTFTVNNTYNSFQDYFNAELSGVVFMGSAGRAFNVWCVRLSPAFNDYKLEVYNTQNIVYTDETTNGLLYFEVEGTEAGNGESRRGGLDVTLNIRNIEGYFLFETLGKEVENQIYHETPDVFDIDLATGQHQMVDHLLSKTHNCYVQGNGGESYQIRSAFNAKALTIDFCPTAVSANEFKQEHRFADITYSGVYNSNTNINKLNEFNLSLGNYKDDIEKTYGSIFKIEGKDTNLEVYQEEKDSIVYYGKDFLSNSDGSENLLSIPEVLGKQKTYEGEYGICTHPESYGSYGFNTYHSDVKRGVWIKKSNNGLFEISSQKMRSYWKGLFRDNTINDVLGAYDQYNDFFIANVKYNNGSYVTWVYSDQHNGWLGRLTFNPEAMTAISGEFYSFQNGEIFKHNQIKDGITDNYNTFYGVESPSTFTFNFSQMPSMRKHYKVMDIEGTHPWQIELKTDLDKGYVNIADFEKKEGVFYGYNRISNGVLDTSLLSTQGLGSATVLGNVLQYAFRAGAIVSVGDQIRNIDGELIGTVLSKTATELTLNIIANFTSGGFTMCCKPQSVENQDLTGYYCQVVATLSSKSPIEVFAMNSEYSISAP